MELWLCNGVYDKLQLPVNPEEIGVEDTRGFEDITLASGQEATVIGGRNLRGYSISSFFPATWAPYVETSSLLLPMDYVEKIKKWMDDKIVLQFQVTSMNINEQVTIRSFSWKEVGGAVGDIEFTLELKEYVPISFSTIISQATSVSARPPSSAPETTARTHTVVKGDCLWNIAKKYYNDGSKWTLIYEKNKGIIGKNPNLIYPGQKLVLP